MTSTQLPTTTTSSSSSSSSAHASSQSQPQSQSTSNTDTHSTQYTNLRNTLLSPSLHEFHLRETSAAPLILPPPSKNQPSSTPSQSTISSLTLHPTLESTLHILNHDLASAHFLLRHAQDPPAHESMYLHGILHRIEGDMDNARAWYSDVHDSDVFRETWGGNTNAKNSSSAAAADDSNWKEYLNRSERWKDHVKKHTDTNTNTNTIDWKTEETDLKKTSLWELTRVLEFCEKKFGTAAWNGDVSDQYTRTQGDKAEIAQQMITGGEGWREF